MTTARACHRAMNRRSSGIARRPSREMRSHSLIWETCITAAGACLRTINRRANAGFDGRDEGDSGRQLAENAVNTAYTPAAPPIHLIKKPLMYRNSALCRWLLKPMVAERDSHPLYLAFYPVTLKKNVGILYTLLTNDTE